MKKIQFILIVSSLLIFSCEKEATIKIPKVDPKLVVSSFISPGDTIIYVTVKKSKPIFEDSNVNTADPITNASVVLSDGTASAALSFDSFVGKYKIAATAFPLIAGKTYYLSVSTPDGKSVSAETTIPANAPADLDLALTPGTTNALEGTVAVNWTDRINEKNYYRLSIVSLQYNTGSADTIQSWSNYDSKVFTDNNHDGHQMSSEETGVPINISNGYKAFEARLICCNVDYYLYHNSVFNGNNGGNPFAEPTLIYSNIKGGLGVFSAYLKVKKRKTY